MQAGDPRAKSSLPIYFPWPTQCFGKKKNPLVSCLHLKIGRVALKKKIGFPFSNNNNKSKHVVTYYVPGAVLNGSLCSSDSQNGPVMPGPLLLSLLRGQRHRGRAWTSALLGRARVPVWWLWAGAAGGCLFQAGHLLCTSPAYSGSGPAWGRGHWASGPLEPGEVEMGGRSKAAGL